MLARCLVLLLALACAAPAIAQEPYPSRPIHIVVGFAAGGAPDALASVVGDRLAQTFKQTVIVENRVGAAGNIAMAAVAKSAGGH